jgi:hypothetical protein
VSAHTPGPWRVDSVKDHDPSLFVEGYHAIDAAGGYAPNGFHIAAYLNDADVRLIAAAPELFAALTEMVEKGEGCAACGDGTKGGCGCRYERARAALAKAVLP